MDVEESARKEWKIAIVGTWGLRVAVRAAEACDTSAEMTRLRIAEHEC